jgi:hypothetical protein
MRAIVFFVEKQCLICSLAQPGAGIGGDRDKIYHTVGPGSDKSPRRKNPILVQRPLWRENKFEYER